MCAYNYYCGGGDTVTAGRPRVKPGDSILVHAGLYKYHAEYYTGDRTINATTPYEGTYYLTASGTPEKPIVIKGAGDGEVNRSLRTDSGESGEKPQPELPLSHSAMSIPSFPTLQVLFPPPAITMTAMPLALSAGAK